MEKITSLKIDTKHDMNEKPPNDSPLYNPKSL